MNIKSIVDGDIMAKFCPSCGEKLVDSAKFCKNCGKNLEDIPNPTGNFEVPVVEESHKLAIVSGYILALFIPLFGVIAAVYLLTRKDSAKALKHGKYVLAVALIVWFLSVLSIFW